MKSWKVGLFALVFAIGALGMAQAGDVESRDGKWELGPFVGFGMLDDYDGPVSLNPDDGALYGFRLGYWYSPKLSIEGSFQNLSTETDLTAGPPNADVDLTSYRFNWLYNFRDGDKWRPFATVGVGSHNTDVEGGFDTDGLGINAGGGVRYAVNDKFGLRFDGRAVSIVPGDPLHGRALDLEATVGASWFLGGAKGDADGDGVSDSRDKCPNTPRGAIVDGRGCPIDGDGDGVFDGIDKCPETPKGNPVDAKGCTKDSDGDGVPNGIDKCPNTPKGATVDANGCAEDADGDGVPDISDKCPNTPKGAKVDTNGCAVDSDGDGVPNGIDKCPNTPKGAEVDKNGCGLDGDGDGVPNGIDKCPNTPRGTKVDEKGCRELFADTDTLVLRGVNFEFNSADLTASSETILNSVAASLKQWPEVRVEVSGYTDSRGNDDYNLQLSARRAQAVRTFLTQRGVNASRLEARGYGESSPVADNDTDGGRAMNRRVELRKLN